MNRLLSLVLGLTVLYGVVRLLLRFAKWFLIVALIVFFWRVFVW